ncbi:MAG: hypothetical protein M9916_05200 [Crocinitomicaceae bacterium]|nr:hypothetical protein [Crocinitomicaceae bacterium]
MNKQRKIELQRAITELEKPYPKDDLILSYSDFLKVRDYLGYYQFNPIVFENILNLTNDNWNTEKRINRFSLLQKIKQYLHITLQDTTRGYYNRNTKPNFQLSVETRKLLFNLFRKTFEEKNYISYKQLDEARKICNNVLINLELTPIEEEWLCANTLVSELILNRVLRYPIKSEVISNWAKSNFKNNILRSRRAELLSWIIDQEPTFEIEQQTLIDDFEYLNQSDLQAIQDYDDEISANKILERELGEYLPKKTHYDFFDSTYHEEKVDLSVPELKLSKRPYGVTIDTSKEYPVSIPNFEKLREDFYINLPTHQKVTMIWAIAYSRLDNTLKYSLLKKYYSNETYYSMYRVCKRTKNIELLKWILENQ